MFEQYTITGKLTMSDVGQKSTQTVYTKRNYIVQSTSHAESIASSIIQLWDLEETVLFGLPEVDDRYHIWRVPVLSSNTTERIGEIVIDAKSGVVDSQRSTTITAVTGRMRLAVAQCPISTDKPKKSVRRKTLRKPDLRNTILCGDSEETLKELPAQSVQLMFTSPPYFNARPDYADYLAYEDYLKLMRKIIRQVARVLEDGRFAVLNCSPVLLRRKKRSEASKRLAVPFDIHALFIKEGFEFIDDIIWQKPEGAGWATGRGRRFAADRNPMQYKAVPVTEYVLVYRKKSDKLIDWFIRNHPDQGIVKNSKIDDGYEKTNIWKIHPAHSKLHPAIFPAELAEKVIQYYSFENDIVLDPFAGIGTTASAALKLDRRFVMSELNPEYVDHIKKAVLDHLGREAADVNCVDCAAISVEQALL